MGHADESCGRTHWVGDVSAHDHVRLLHEGLVGLILVSQPQVAPTDLGVHLHGHVGRVLLPPGPGLSAHTSLVGYKALRGDAQKTV